MSGADPEETASALRQRAVDEEALATGRAAQAYLPLFRARLERHARALARPHNRVAGLYHRWRMRRAGALVAAALSDIETARIVRAATRATPRDP